MFPKEKIGKFSRKYSWCVIVIVFVGIIFAHFAGTLPSYAVSWFIVGLGVGRISILTFPVKSDKCCCKKEEK
jgi:F0F1-type ATP synthase assembly protein I